jgi:selenocysteine lyase/cysteine desulfurase
MASDAPGLGRRAFLTTGAAALAGGAFVAGRSSAPGETRSPPPVAAPASRDVSSWPAVRSQFAASRDEVHLDGFVLAIPPEPVRSAVDAHRRAFDRDGVAYLHREEARAERAVLAAAADYLETEPELIALTDSTSMGLGLIYGGAVVSRGDELLTTTHDFYATHEAMRFAALRTGATVRKISLYGDPARASADEMVERLVGAVGAATRLIGVTWVHSGTGVKLPIRAIADALAEINERGPEARRVLLAVDGVHGFGVDATPVARLGCDLFAAGCHKWLYGPRGTGIVWGRADGWAALAPVIPSFGREQYAAWMTGRPSPLGTLAWGPTMTPGGYHSFEQRWALAHAFDFHLRIGRERVQERIRALAEQLKAGLREIPGVRVSTPADRAISAGIVCFSIGSSNPDEVVARLRERGVRISVAPYATRNLRAGPTLWVDEAGIERALAEIRRIA